MPQVNLQRDKKVQCRKNQFHDPDKFNNNLKKHNKPKTIKKNALNFAASDKGRNEGRCYTAANNKGNINQGITSIS